MGGEPAPGPRDATDEQLRRARHGDARPLEWTDELPDGLGTEVGEYGGWISGGRQQRLAAALLADFLVLVLDEPGEQLDTVAVDAVVADLLDASSAQAILLITHGVAGLEAVDEVIVLDAGCVVERGTHAQLLAMDGAYAELWRRESGD